MKKEEISSKTISDANMYDELMKDFEYKLSFKLLRQHKDEIMEWINQSSTRATKFMQPKHNVDRTL